MSELRLILDAVLSTTEPAVLATVVRVSGSAYRRPGARLLLCRDGHRVGGVSGGCLEGDIARKAWWRTEHGSTVVRYDSTGGDAEAEAAFGLGCNGVVDVLLERFDSKNPSTGLVAARQWLTARKVGVVARVIGGSSLGGTLTLGPDGSHHDLPEVLADAVRAEADAALADGLSRVVEVAGAEVFFEVIRPPQSLLGRQEAATRFAPLAARLRRSARPATPHRQTPRRTHRLHPHHHRTRQVARTGRAGRGRGNAGRDRARARDRRRGAGRRRRSPRGDALRGSQSPRWRPHADGQR